MKKIGVLTSGGDSPGMNAAIRAVVRTCAYHNIQCVGIYRGYQGMIEGDFKEMGPRSVNNTVNKGGTILKSARSKEFMTIEGRKKAHEQLVKDAIDAFVVIGGDGRVRLYDKTTDSALSTEESMVMLKQGKRMPSNVEGNSSDEEEFIVSA